MSFIHPSALIDPQAELASDVKVGPFVVIDGPVRLGAGCKVESHAVLRGRMEVGENCVFGHHCVIGANPQDRSFDPRVDSGVRIGSRNVLREFVTVHRGSKDGAWTVIGDDNYLMAVAHLAHDVQLGSQNNLANNVMLAGHVEVGNGCFFGGGAGVHQFVRIGNQALLQGNSGASQDVAPYTILASVNEVAGINVVALRRSGLTGEQRAQLRAIWKRLIRGPGKFELLLAEFRGVNLPPTAQALVDFCAQPSKKGLARKPIALVAKP